MTQIDELVKELRKINNGLACLAANALEIQSAELTRLRERNAELEQNAAEAYQAVGMLIETIGADDDENVVRLQDILAYGKTQDGKDLLPFPLLSNVRAEKAEARISSLEATARELREALVPFSEAAKQLDDDFRDVSDIWEHSSAMAITGADIRNAARVVAASESVVVKSEGEKNGE
jgi:hypothetical protein